MAYRNNHKNLRKRTGYFKNEHGAIDLYSIMVGIIVIAIIAGLIAATIFVLIPWVQDRAAKQQVKAIVTAEHAHIGLSSSNAAVTISSPANSFADSAQLEAAGLLRQGASYCAISLNDGKQFEAYARSATGNVFIATDRNTKPQLHNEVLPTKCSSLKPSNPTDPYVDPTPFLTMLTYQCDTTTTGTIPMRSALTGTETWNDGTPSQTYLNAASGITKTLEAGKEYKVRFEGTYERFNSVESQLYPCLRSMDHWGADSGVKDATYGFAGAQNLQTVPANIPTTITNMTYMFYSAGTFNDPNVSRWNVSNVTIMSYAFAMVSFNQPLNDWNVGNVTQMSGLFYGADQFDQPLDKWDVSKVEDMSYMFGATPFNQNISEWKTSNVTLMNNMFWGTTEFNQPLAKWDVSKVTNMNYMFSQAGKFNQPLSSWTTGSVTSMNNMFSLNKAFNGDIQGWNVSAVTDMYHMFEGAEQFNKPLNSWTTTNLQNAESLFYGAAAFNQPLNNWNVSKVTTMKSMFANASAFNQNIDSWRPALTTNMSYMFSRATSYNQPMNSWTVGNVTLMSYMFYNATNFNQPLNSWNVSKVTDMSFMFNGASVFNADLSTWSTNTRLIASSFARPDFPKSYLPPRVLA